MAITYQLNFTFPLEAEFSGNIAKFYDDLKRLSPHGIVDGFILGV